MGGGGAFTDNVHGMRAEFDNVEGTLGGGEGRGKGKKPSRMGSIKMFKATSKNQLIRSVYDRSEHPAWWRLVPSPPPPQVK